MGDFAVSHDFAVIHDFAVSHFFCCNLYIQAPFGAKHRLTRLLWATCAR